MKRSIQAIDSTPTMQLNSCKTVVKAFSIIYKWTIKNYSFYGNSLDDIIESPLFSSKESNDIEWNIKVYPGGIAKNNSDFIGIFVNSVTKKHQDLKITGELSLLNKDHDDCFTISLNMQLTNGKFDIQQMGSRKFVMRSFLETRAPTWLPDDTLTILCEMDVVINSVNQMNPQRHIFRDLYKNAALADLTFVVKGKEIKAHSYVLAQNSDDFQDMLTKREDENSQNRFEIIEVQPKSFEEMLRFIYTGEQPAFTQSLALDILFLTDKFDIPGLKELCVSFLCSDLNVSKAIKILYAIEMYNAQEFKNYLFAYVCSIRSISLMNDPDWEQLVEKFPHYAEEYKKELETNWSK